MLEVAQPEWFFDDALSRLRWRWAASMRESDVAADPGRGEGLTLDDRSAPVGRVAGWQAGTPVPADQD